MPRRILKTSHLVQRVRAKNDEEIKAQKVALPVQEADFNISPIDEVFPKNLNAGHEI